MSLVQPTITDWLQGIGTTAGTIFAAVAAFAAIMLFRHEIKVRRHDEADKQAAQARSVFVTFEEVTSADPQVGGLILPRDDDKLVASVDIYIHNLSDAVIADASWKATRTDTNDVILRMGNDILGPGEKSGMRCTLNPPQLWRLETHPPDLFRFDLQFTDARGLRWRRVNREQPVREM
jgi:hypothetical protein